jgi:hypothetical protein
VIATGSSLHGPLSTLVGIEEAAREHDYFVTVATPRDYGVGSLNRVLEHFLGHGVDGIVVIVPHDTVAHVLDHFHAPVPIVMITSREEGRDVPAPRRSPASTSTSTGAPERSPHTCWASGTRTSCTSPDRWTGSTPGSASGGGVTGCGSADRTAPVW